MSLAYVLVPNKLTDAMFTSSTLAEPASGEVLWNAATSYVVGDKVIRSQTHRIYENNTAGVNATAPELTLQDTLPRWTDIGPTARWAAFDELVNTASSTTNSLTYVLRLGMFNALAFYGLVGATLTVSIKNAPGGTVVYTSTTDLIEPPMDYYDYYFGKIKQTDRLVLKNLVPYADPEITVTISAGTGAPVGIGMFVFGDLRGLLTAENTGGTQYGAQAKPTTYSYISTDAFGKSTIVPRVSSTDMEFNVFLPQGDTDGALLTLQEVLAIPAAWIASDQANYKGLNVFGLASGTVIYESYNHSIMSIQVKGFI